MVNPLCLRAKLVKHIAREKVVKLNKLAEEFGIDGGTTLALLRGLVELDDNEVYLNEYGKAFVGLGIADFLVNRYCKEGDPRRRT